MGDYHKTDYPGVLFREKINGQTGIDEKIYYIRYRDHQGNPHFEKVGSSKSAMTAAKANVVRTRRIEGKEGSNRVRRQMKRAQEEALANRWTIERLWVHYLEHNEIKGVERDCSTFNRHLKARFGLQTPAEIDPLEIERMKKSMLKKEGFQPQTVKNALSLLRRICNWGWKKRLSDRLDFPMEMPKVNNEKKEALRPDQVASLLEVLDRETDLLEANFLKMILFTGRRTGEICKLRWEDVNLEAQTFLLRDTKTNQHELLALADEMVRLLKAMPKYHETWVFPNRLGGQRQRADEPTRAIVKAAGIPPEYRPTYCLRHTFASYGATVQSEKPYVLKELMGHNKASRDITNRYVAVPLQEQLKVVNAIVAKMMTTNSNTVHLPR